MSRSLNCGICDRPERIAGPILKIGRLIRDVFYEVNFVEEVLVHCSNRFQILRTAIEGLDICSDSSTPPVFRSAVQAPWGKALNIIPAAAGDASHIPVRSSCIPKVPSVHCVGRGGGAGGGQPQTSQKLYFEELSRMSGDSACALARRESPI